MRLPTRLTLQIYLVSVVQLAVVAGAIALIGWLTFRQRGFGEPHGQAGFVVETVAQHWREPERMQAEAERVRRTTKGKLSIYTADGSLLVSNVTPALAPRGPG